MQAEALLDQAIKAGPTRADAYCFKAVVRFEFLDDPTTAKSALAKCQALHPPSDVAACSPRWRPRSARHQRRRAGPEQQVRRRPFRLQQPRGRRHPGDDHRDLRRHIHRRLIGRIVPPAPDGALGPAHVGRSTAARAELGGATVARADPGRDSTTPTVDPIPTARAAGVAGGPPVAPPPARDRPWVRRGVPCPRRTRSGTRPA